MNANGKEMLEQNNQKLYTLIDGMVKRLGVFDQKKAASTEDIREVETYKNGAGLVVKANNALRDNLLAIDKTTRSVTPLNQGVKRKTA
jgi:hypothetical protein